MNAGQAIAGVLMGALAACSGARHAPGDGADGIAELQRLVRAGAPYFTDEPCAAAPLYAMLDDDDAELRLERAALAVATSTPSVADVARCRRSIALSRLLSRARRGKLEVSSEAQHPLAEARTFAALLLRFGTSTAPASPEPEGQDACADHRSAIGAGDPAREQRAAQVFLEDRLARVEGHLVGNPRAPAPCALRPSYVERLIESTSPERVRARAMLAATLLLEHHPRLTDLALGLHRSRASGELAAPWLPYERSERERRDVGQECLSDADCLLPDRCIRGGGFSTRGICGQLVDPMGVPTAYPGSGQSCRYDGDCPPRARCRMISALEGICVQR